MIRDLLFFSVGGSLIFAVVWSLDRSTASVMKTSWRRLWWLLVPAAFLLPLEIPVQFSWWPSALAAQGALEAASPKTLEEFVVQGSQIPFAAEKAAPLSWLVLAWLSGAFGYLALVCRQTLRVHRFWSQKRLSTDPLLLGLLEDCKAAARVTAPIGLVVSSDIDSPALLGWLRPRILLPEKLCGDSSRGLLRGVFLHELAHFRNGDIPLNWLFVLVRAAHWFNPVAHLAARSWEGFREEAADEAAMDWMGDSTASSYGDCLLGFLHNNSSRPSPQGALGIAESLANLKRRITMINHHPSKRSHAPLGICLAAFLCAATLISPAPAQSGDSESTKKQAVEAMEQWTQTIDAGNYGQSWSEASAFFKKALTEKQWKTALEGVRTPLGACKARTLASILHQTEVPSPTGGTIKGNYMIAQFHASYANMAEAIETVSFEKEADGKWRACGYYIKPRM